MTYNLKDFYVRIGADISLTDEKFYRKYKFVPKTKAELNALAADFLLNKPDVAILQEVGRLEHIQEFIKKFLNDEYIVYFANGNDGVRKIAFMVHKNLSVKSVQLISHAKRTWRDPLYSGLPQPVFIRDAPVLLINLSDGRKLGILGVHLSAGSTRVHGGRTDPFSQDRRDAEINEVSNIVKELRYTHGDNFPLIVGGDWNESTYVVQEKLGNNNRLDNSLNLSGVPKRFQFSMFLKGEGGTVYSRAIDALYVSESSTARVIQSFVFTGSLGNDVLRPPPSRQNELLLRPSEHAPVIVDLELLN